MTRAKDWSDQDIQTLVDMSAKAFTSRFCGDPPPGRSALDQRASQSIPSNKRQQNG